MLIPSGQLKYQLAELIDNRPQLSASYSVASLITLQYFGTGSQTIMYLICKREFFGMIHLPVRT